MMTPMEKTIKRLADFFGEKGYESYGEDADVILPTDLFLDHATRDVRSLLYMLADSEGREFYLRPDFTVPICRDHVRALRESGDGAARRRIFYAGSVFRVIAGESRCRRKIQLGIENFNDNPVQTDAEILALAEEALRLTDAPDCLLEMGDPSLFDSLVDALEMTANWRNRLKRLFRQSRQALPALLRGAGDKPRQKRRGDNDALMEKMRAAPSQDAEAILRDHLKKQPLRHIGMRSLAEIAQSLRERAVLSAPALPKETIQILNNYLLIRAPLSKALSRMEECLRPAAPHILSRQIQEIARRMDEMRKRGMNPEKAHFNASFYSGLGYYTGFVFSFAPKDAGAGTGAALAGAALAGAALAGGGRYDGFLKSLGAAGTGAAGAGAALYLTDIAERKQTS